MSINRRQFIQASCLALCTSLVPCRVQANRTPQPLLPVPPLLESYRGQPLFLTWQQVRWALLANSKRVVWGINGQYLGPTVRVNDGDNTKLIYSNQLAEPVSMTISGLQVPGTLAGGMARVIPPGAGWSPVLPIRQAAATCWYHANTPRCMAAHLYNGLAGMWLVEDDVSRSLPLPKEYGVDDFPLILQDKQQDNFTVTTCQSPTQEGFIGDTLLVNGVQNPYVMVAHGWIRLRLLNASTARRYILQLSDEQLLWVVAGDQGFLSMPVAVRQFSLAPGERREVVIDMSQEREVSLIAGIAVGVMDRLRSLFKPSHRLISTRVLTLKSTGLLSRITDNLPTYLPAAQIPVGNVSYSRAFYLGDRRSPGINGLLWNKNRIDVYARQGTWERWSIHADMPQSFHIQGVSFLIESVNGAPAVAEDRGWKDTLWVEGDVELLVYFHQLSSKQFPFFYYSRDLHMADRGSIGQLLVQPATV